MISAESPVRKTTDSFSFDLPEGWASFQDGSRLVAQGPGGEELILSSRFVKAPPTASNEEVARLVAVLLDNATRAAQETVAQPDIEVTSALARRLDAGGWFVLDITRSHHDR